MCGSRSGEGSNTRGLVGELGHVVNRERKGTTWRRSHRESLLGQKWLAQPEKWCIFQIPFCSPQGRRGDCP